MRMPSERATQTAARVGQGVAMLFGLVGLFVSPLLILIAVFVWLGAQAEHSVSTVRVALAGLSVRHGMITNFKDMGDHYLLNGAKLWISNAPFCDVAVVWAKNEAALARDIPLVCGALRRVFVGPALREGASRGSDHDGLAG